MVGRHWSRHLLCLCAFIPFIKLNSLFYRSRRLPAIFVRRLSLNKSLLEGLEVELRRKSHKNELIAWSHTADVTVNLSATNAVTIAFDSGTNAATNSNIIVTTTTTATIAVNINKLKCRHTTAERGFGHNESARTEHMVVRKFAKHAASATTTTTTRSNNVPIWILNANDSYVVRSSLSKLMIGFCGTSHVDYDENTVTTTDASLFPILLMRTVLLLLSLLFLWSVLPYFPDLWLVLLSKSCFLDIFYWSPLLYYPT